MGKKEVKNSKHKEEISKLIKQEEISRLIEKIEAAKREIEENIIKQQDKASKKKTGKKEEKLEEMVEKEKLKRKQPEDSSGSYLQQPLEKGVDYEYIFSYIGSGIRTGLSSEYNSSAGEKGELSARARTDEIMDFKEQESYASKQAANFLLGTGMNHISYDEKIRFDAFMNDPSNKIIFLINYGMLGMNWKMPERASANSQYQEVKMTNEEIKEKSMKNDPAIALRFDTKITSIKEYIK